MFLQMEESKISTTARPLGIEKVLPTTMKRWDARIWLFVCQNPVYFQDIMFGMNIQATVQEILEVLLTPYFKKMEAESVSISIAVIL